MPSKLQEADNAQKIHMLQENKLSYLSFTRTQI